MQHTTNCQKCGATICTSKGKNSDKIPEKYEGLGGVEREILSETLKKQYLDEPKIKGM